MSSDWDQRNIQCVFMYICIYATYISIYMQTMDVCFYLCILYVCMSGKSLQKNQINYCIWGNCVHRNRLCAQRHNSRFCMLTCNPRDYCFPCFYLNPDLVQHWETTLAFLLTAVNQSKKRAFGKHQHIEGHTISPAFVFSVISVNRRLIYWKYLVLIRISESSK